MGQMTFSDYEYSNRKKDNEKRRVPRYNGRNYSVGRMGRVCKTILSQRKKRTSNKRYRKAIAAVSGIAQLRNKKKHSGDAFVQGMEKLIDSMRGKSYTAVYIADLMSNSKIEEICSQYEDLYLQLSPFQRSVQTLNENSSKTVTDSILKGIVDTTNESLAKSVTHGTTHGFMKGKSSGWTVHGGLKIKMFDVGGGYHWEKQENEQYGISDSEGNTVTTGKAKSLTEQNSVANALMSGQGESLQIVTDSFASHTFITGSTGTGKSNTVYQLIDKVRDKDIHFMVIEPAKGEYKERLGKDCHVFGTNSDETELLYINPFSFPEKIHVLEHIDRLVEILNACWPMYAAMPAVLKDSIERVYTNKGWNLQKSNCCISGSRRFPTFADLLVTLPEVMDESSYSADTKSDYSGALVTRIKSLTNGLNGQLLCSGIETSEKVLFEKDTIVDLSRVGSMETRSFFMGILVMKLQEYHMSHKKAADENLKHIIVLEEAHNDKIIIF